MELVAKGNMVLVAREDADAPIEIIAQCMAPGAAQELAKRYNAFDVLVSAAENSSDPAMIEILRKVRQ